MDIYVCANVYKYTCEYVFIYLYMCIYTCNVYTRIHIGSPSSATNIFGLLQEERQRFDSQNNEIKDQQVIT